MDTKGSSFSGPWTNEKHVHYLNSMEASFVRTMLENNGRLLRLDRYLPDTSDSTLDLKTQRRKKHTTSGADIIIGPRSGIDRRRRRQSYHHYPHTSSQDQVVPQLGDGRGDKDESDPSDAPANR
ncbi:C5a peptidase [Melia azedarach]|uniref:C5a peptidase n=1 Tax=Melia azedarach TaxID=155640 RepID=A0ACC1X430_MELAZ|nr:C5a peptidase [Melia azedarach]